MVNCSLWLLLNQIVCYRRYTDLLSSVFPFAFYKLLWFVVEHSLISRIFGVGVMVGFK